MKKTKTIEEVFAEDMKDPEFRRACEIEEMKNLPILLSYRLAQVRKAGGITQEQLAEKVGTKQPDIARFEKGNQTSVKLSTIIKIAEALGVKVEFTIKPLGEAGQAQERVNGKRKAA